MEERMKEEGRREGKEGRKACIPPLKSPEVCPGMLLMSLLPAASRLGVHGMQISKDLWSLLSAYVPPLLKALPWIYNPRTQNFTQ